MTIPRTTLILMQTLVPVRRSIPGAAGADQLHPLLLGVTDGLGALRGRLHHPDVMRVCGGVVPLERLHPLPAGV